MRYSFLFPVLLLLNISAQGQNLLANSSFERMNYCEANIPCSPAAWYSVSDIPFGYENDLTVSIHGKHSLAFLIASGEGIRSYWQTKILCKLVKGREYSVRFDIRPFSGEFNPEYFGITLMDKLFRSKNDTLIQIERNASIHPEKIRSQKNGWIQISTSFVATGTEDFILMGNFNLLSNEAILKTDPFRPKFIGYYIDNVVLQPRDKTIKICAESIARMDSLFAEKSRHKIGLTTKILESKIPDTRSSISIKDTIILGNIHFNFDSDELLNPAILDDYFNSMNSYEITGIQIIGYTDSIGNFSYNQKLSERRAFTVKNYLIKNLKLQPVYINSIGKGVTRDQEQLELNRKVEIIISKKVY